jgi:asparagine N-glycosylation enzyme membrane subunit Stt3
MARSKGPRFRLRRRREIVLRQRYGLLLTCLIVLFLVSGIAPAGPLQEVVLTALAAVTLVLALRAGEVSKRLDAAATAVGTALVILVAILAVAGVDNAGAARFSAFALVAIAPPAIVVGVVRGLREQGTATIRAVMGVLCIYLLLGMLAAFLYGGMDRVGSKPFFANGAPATTSNCLYFSFITLTTVGYGDLTPRSNLGHTIAASEALVGQIYLVTVVALLVSNLGRRPDLRVEPEPGDEGPGQ